MMAEDGWLRQQPGAETGAVATAPAIKAFLGVNPGKSPRRTGANMSKRTASKNGKSNALESRTAAFKYSPWRAGSRNVFAQNI